MADDFTSGDFIQVYPDVIDAATCASIIERFEASGQDHPGRRRP